MLVLEDSSLTFSTGMQMIFWAIFANYFPKVWLKIILINKLFLNLFKKTPFFSLLSGSILAQAVTLISMPFISKLYGPTEIGLISIFISFLTIPSALSLFKLEGVLLIYTDNRQIKGIWLIYLFSMLRNYEYSPNQNKQKYNLLIINGISTNITFSNNIIFVIKKIPILIYNLLMIKIF